MSDFGDYLMSTGGGSAGATFSTKTPRPYVDGVTTNVLQGTVNTGSRPITRMVGGEPTPGTESTSMTVQQAAMSLYGLSPDEIRKVQSQLVSAGYLTAKDITTSGVVDGATAKAYGDLLQDTSAYNAAGNPMSINDLLEQRVKSIAASGGAATTRNGMTLETSNPLDIAETAQAVAERDLGRKLKPKELQSFISVYHGIEQHRNTQMVTNDTTLQAGGNVTTQAAPSVQADAGNFVQQQYGAEKGAHDVAGQFRNFLDIIKGI